MGNSYLTRLNQSDNYTKDIQKHFIETKCRNFRYEFDYIRPKVSIKMNGVEIYTTEDYEEGWKEFKKETSDC